MIYGCHNDPLLEYINDSVDEVLAKNERYAEESTRYGINRDQIITEFTKSIIEDLHTLISSLREEITFLRVEMKSKSSIIENLVMQTEKLVISSIDKEIIPNSGKLNDNSIYLNNLMESQEIVFRNIDDKHVTIRKKRPHHINASDPLSNTESVSQYLESISLTSSFGCDNDKSDEFNISDNEHDHTVNNEATLSFQLMEIRKRKHHEYGILKQGNEESSPGTNVEKKVKCYGDRRILKSVGDTNDKKKLWNKGTCLVIGDSTLNGIKEELMGPNFKVRAHSGAIIQDIYSYIAPLLPRNPTYVILMVGTNDAIEKDSNKILNELLDLKKYIESKSPECKVIISCPTCRFDHAKARITIFNLRKKLDDLDIMVILNENIGDNLIGRKGLHLNEHGSGRLAVNYLTHIRKH